MLTAECWCSGRGRPRLFTRYVSEHASHSTAGTTPASVGSTRPRGIWYSTINVHSRLTPTQVRRVIRPRSEKELVASLRSGLRHCGGISIAGGRHAMGAQPFGTGSLHFDLTGVNRVGDLDSNRGIVASDATGARWFDHPDRI